VKTYEQAIADAADAFNEYLANEGRHLATVTTLEQPPTQTQATPRRTRARKAA
jgi:hypothetical protein